VQEIIHTREIIQNNIRYICALGDTGWTGNERASVEVMMEGEGVQWATLNVQCFEYAGLE
jgi:hypothetical protein